MPRFFSSIFGGKKLKVSNFSGSNRSRALYRFPISIYLSPGCSPFFFTFRFLFPHLFIFIPSIEYRAPHIVEISRFDAKYLISKYRVWKYRISKYRVSKCRVSKYRLSKYRISKYFRSKYRIEYQALNTVGISQNIDVSIIIEISIFETSYIKISHNIVHRYRTTLKYRKTLKHRTTSDNRRIPK